MDQVGLYAGGIDECIEDFAMTFSGLRSPDGIRIEPFADLAPRLGAGLGPFEESRVRDDAKESHETGPRQADQRTPAELRIEPIAGACVLWERTNVRVD